jgi:hypothetical protein
MYSVPGRGAHVASTRHLPEALPEGARYSISRSRCHTIHPAIMNLEILYPAPRTRRCRRPAIRVDLLTPEVVSPQRAPRGSPA